MRYAETLEADYIATGHYVSQSLLPDSGTKPPAGLNETIKILKGSDTNKDKPTFCRRYRSTNSRAAFFLWAIGENQTYDAGESLGLTNHRKKDSTGICFIGERRFADFLAQYIQDEPGPMTDRQAGFSVSIVVCTSTLSANDKASIWVALPVDRKALGMCWPNDRQTIRYW